MSLRTFVSLLRGSIAARRDACVTARWCWAAALLVAVCVPSHAAGHAGGALSTGSVTTGRFVPEATARQGMWPADALGGPSVEQLAFGGIEPTFPSMTRVDHAAGNDIAPGFLPSAMGSLPAHAVPEPSELALLGDGMLVLLAWIAGRQARRSRSMAAMTGNHAE